MEHFLTLKIGSKFKIHIFLLFLAKCFSMKSPHHPMCSMPPHSPSLTQIVSALTGAFLAYFANIGFAPDSEPS